MKLVLNDKSDTIYKSVLYNAVRYVETRENLTVKYYNEKIFFNFLCIAPGQHILNFENNKIVIRFNEIGIPIEVDNTSYIHSEIVLECELEELILTFLKDSVTFLHSEILNKKKKENKINYYIWDDYWDNILKKDKRPMNTLCFSNNIHNNLLDSVKIFLSKEEEMTYKKYGIPYKFNVLLEGYPGTGKTSLITAIASELDFNIATISFDNEMTDRKFVRALKLIPDKTILLLEDIDVLFKERKENDNYKSALSFSGLINSLDGTGSIDRLIIFMTTNYCCNLDSALKRPGRIDKVIHFDYCNKEQVKLMYYKFLENREDKFGDFYKEIKNYNLTSAILQKYFFENRKESCLLKNISDIKKVASNQNYDGSHINIYS